MLNNIIRQTKLVPDLFDGMCYYGYSVATNHDGDVIAVGAPMQDSAQGIVYIYRLTDNNWVLEEALSAGSDSCNNFFGKSIAMSADGERIAVGAMKDCSDKAVIHVFKRYKGRRHQTSKLSPFIGIIRDISISISANGNTLVVGGYSGNYKADSVFIYKYVNNEFIINCELKSPNHALYDSFGSKVCISKDGSTIAATACNKKLFNNYVFIYTKFNSTWKIKSLLKPPDSIIFEQFGCSLSFNENGSKIIIGADRAEHSFALNKAYIRPGAVYIYSLNSATNEWNCDIKLLPKTALNNDHIGCSVSMNNEGNLLAIGAFNKDSGRGGIFIYKLENSIWTSCGYLLAHDNEVNSYLGYSLDISGNGNILVSGALTHTVCGKRTGAVYVFR